MDHQTTAANDLHGLGDDRPTQTQDDIDVEMLGSQRVDRSVNQERQEARSGTSRGTSRIF